MLELHHSNELISCVANIDHIEPLLNYKAKYVNKGRALFCVCSPLKPARLPTSLKGPCFPIDLEALTCSKLKLCL